MDFLDSLVQATSEPNEQAAIECLLEGDAAIRDAILDSVVALRERALIGRKWHQLRHADGIEAAVSVSLRIAEKQDEADSLVRTAHALIAGEQVSDHMSKRWCGGRRAGGSQLGALARLPNM